MGGSDEGWERVRARLERVRATLVDKESMIINVSADAGSHEVTQPAMRGFIERMPAALPSLSSASLPSSTSRSPSASWIEQPPNLLFPTENEGFAVATQVNYVARAVALYRPG